MEGANLQVAALSKSSSGSSESSRISSSYMQNVVDRLLCKQNRTSTSQTYFRIWRIFNKFLISLDKRPKHWEDRVTLFVGHLIEKGLQSSTVKSYVSAIKRILTDDGYQWNNDKILLASLTRACRIINDRVCTRLPISSGLLELILFEIQRKYANKNQLYLEIMYKALFSIGYFGLLRAGELVDSEHAIKAAHIHMAQNKEKIMIVLYSSKTHDKANRPQHIRIIKNIDERSGNYCNRVFCPFQLVDEYLRMRGDYDHMEEQLFIHRDGSPVSQMQMRQVLSSAIQALGLNHQLYGVHSLRLGRATDLAKFSYSLEEIRQMGRWRSNVVYKLHQTVVSVHKNSNNYAIIIILK